ncbi:MAG: SRPBCC family protein [Betaproteobacteria bacterium]|nr:SRPBCC family protein [Betaproteobacteria bacterium]
MTSTAQIDPKLDLVLERYIDVSPEMVWTAWTDPEHLKQWFTPAPWKTVDCEIDLRPGGKFHTVMQSPEGQKFPNAGCYLEVVPNRRLTFTSALGPGFRPAAPAGADSKECAEILFTAIVTMEPKGKGCRYHVVAMHGEEGSRKRHEEMGFHEGWGAALDQLVALMQKS